MFKTVLLALNGSEESQAAIPYALELVDPGGTIHVVHVREIMLGRGSDRYYVQEDEVEDELRRTARGLAAGGVDVNLTFQTGIAGGAARVVAEAARTVGADVVVLGTRGHGRILGILLGSVAQRLLGLAPCPVVAVPPRSSSTSTVSSATWARLSSEAQVANRPSRL